MVGKRNKHIEYFSAFDGFCMLRNFALNLSISTIDDKLTGKQKKELKTHLEKTQELPQEEREQGIIEKLKASEKI